MYRSFHLSRIGASHIRKGIPCQDASLSLSCPEGEIAIVADGHGNRRHFRSARGAKLACEVARDKIISALREEALESTERDLFEEPDMDLLLTKMKREILIGWADAVYRDYEDNPWTEEELFEQEDLLSPDQFESMVRGRNVLIAYGSTLLASFTFEGGWAAIQIGDGCVVRIERDGQFEWPMPESTVNDGNKTASLCMSNAMCEFRHCYGTDAGIALLVFTDGIEKSFPSQGKEITSLLHWIWKNEKNDYESKENNLARTLDLITDRSTAGDDMSIAGLIDPEAEDVAPKLSKRQKELERERVLAQITEMESTIRYNSKRLIIEKMNAKSNDNSAVGQLKEILKRKKTAVEELRKKLEMLPEAEQPAGSDEENLS